MIGQKGRLAYILLFGLLFVFSMTTAAVSDDASRAPVGVKFMVGEEGIYRVYAEDIAVAWIATEAVDRLEGVDKIDPRKLNLFNRGEPVFIYIHGEKDGKLDAGDYIEFYGIHNKGEYTFTDKYCPQNAYILTQTPRDVPPKRFASEQSQSLPFDPALPKNPPNLFYRSRHFERDALDKWNRFNTYGNNRTDFGFWTWIDSIKRPEFQWRFSLRDISSDEATIILRAMVFGRSNLPVSPNHHVKVFLNEREIGDVTFEGITDYLIEIKDLSTSIFKPYDNTIRFFLPGDLEKSNKIELIDGKILDHVMFDWFEVEYPLAYRGYDEFIGQVKENAFPETSGNEQRVNLEIRRFTDPNIKVYDVVGGVRISPWVREVREYLTEDGKREKEFSIAFGIDLNHESRLIALSEPKFRAPASIRPLYCFDGAPFIHDRGVELAIVCYEEFYEPLVKLKQWREKNGMPTALVRASDVYDAFNDGIKHPDGIKKYFSFLYNQEGEHKFKYGLLVGEASSDPRNITRSARRDLLPTYYYNTTFSMEFASDNFYAKMDEVDDKPDIAIGRLPAGSVEDVANYVEKIIALEKASQEKSERVWGRNAVVIASYEGDIQKRCDQIVEGHLERNGSFDVDRIYATEDAAYKDDAIVRITDAFAAGTGIMVFVGHGGNYVWEAGPTRMQWKNLFSVEDVKKLHHPPKFPIVLTATCYSGAFDIPADQQSIGMTLINQAAGGAIAVFGISDRDVFLADIPFMNQLIDIVASGKAKRLGDAFIGAKANISNPQTIEAMNLLGDPSLDISHLIPPAE